MRLVESLICVNYVEVPKSEKKKAYFINFIKDGKSCSSSLGYQFGDDQNLMILHDGCFPKKVSL